MKKNADQYNQQGLQLVQNGRLTEAVDLFTKAVKLDPSFAAGYHNRGETYLLLNRVVEANTDIQKAKDLRSGKLRMNKPKRPKTNIAISEIDSIYDSVFPSDTSDADSDNLSFGDILHDHVFSDDAINTQATWKGFTQTGPETASFPAILEFIGGKRIEVAGAILFKPTDNDISLTRQDGHVERVIPLEQLACIRITGMSRKVPRERDSSCHVEIIETSDGNIYHEAIHPDQNLENVLLGFSTKEQTRFIYSLIPKVNIKKRCQERYLGDILLEKRFISSDIFKSALNEHKQTKSMKLGKIIAQKSQVLYATIEEELKKAKQENLQGLKTGEILLASGLVNEEQVLEALEYQENMQNMKIGEFLIEKGVIQEQEVYIALAEKFKIPFVDLRKQKVSKKTLTYLPKNFVLQNEILPIALDDGKLTVASLRVDVSTVLRETIIKKCQCQDVEFVLTQPTHLRNIINLLYQKIGLGR